MPKTAALLLVLLPMALGHSAILFGASGAVGGQALQSLSNSKVFETIYVVGRRALPATQTAGLGPVPFEEVVVPDLFQLEYHTKFAELRRKGRVSACLIAVGLGDHRNVSLKKLYQVDVELAKILSRACSSLGVRALSLLSGMTADTSLAPLTEEELRLPGELSLLDFFTWYPRVKGEAERAISDSGVPKIRIFRPSTLVTDDIRFGWIDWMLFKIHYVLDPIIPSEWHSIHVRDVGHAMTIASEDALKGTTSDKDEEQQVTFLEYAHMTQLLESRKAPRHSEL